MWLLFSPAPRPDAPYWLGRRWLAAVDALVWPAGWVLLLRALPDPGGVVLPLISAVAAMAAFRRLHRAIWVNHRYRFTTWRCCRAVGALLMIGWILKSMLLA